MGSRSPAPSARGKRKRSAPAPPAGARTTTSGAPTVSVLQGAATGCPACTVHCTAALRTLGTLTGASKASSRKKASASAGVPAPALGLTTSTLLLERPRLSTAKSVAVGRCVRGNSR